MMLSYRYHETDNKGDRNIDSKDHFVAVGLSGNLTPRLTGYIEGGAQERNFRSP